MKDIRSWLVRMTEGVFCLGMFMMVVPVVLGMQCYTVISESMEPEIPKGAVIYVRKISLFRDQAKGCDHIPDRAEGRYGHPPGGKD